ncbi:MAG: CRISPR-associated endonuclease Cas3'', partial [Desulfovibrio sp.]|nr:CRISPR-associated endonuclease Cas3'' [Desulfovibrio sp.]
MQQGLTIFVATIIIIMMFAHISESDNQHTEWRVQTLDEHEEGVARLSSKFAKPFGFAGLARVIGLLHDKGKEQMDWQKYLQGTTGYNKDYACVKSGPNHSYVGACIAHKLYPQIAPLMGQPIAGHHRGLYDYCDYVEELKRGIPSDVSIGEKLSPSFHPLSKLRPSDLHHVVRMLFSCLVDADSLDTEAFMNPEQAK